MPWWVSLAAGGGIGAALAGLIAWLYTRAIEAERDAARSLVVMLQEQAKRDAAAHDEDVAKLTDVLQASERLRHDEAGRAHAIARQLQDRLEEAHARAIRDTTVEGTRDWLDALGTGVWSEHANIAAPAMPTADTAADPHD